MTAARSARRSRTAGRSFGKRLLVRLVVAFAFWNRRRKLRVVIELMDAARVRRVLLVGVSRTSDEAENVIEVGITERAPFAVGCGLEVPIEDHWDSFVVCNALALPFRDGAFDLVVSNAIIEHVGGEAEQLQFVAEHARVGRRWVTTTPNRYFPVEPHTRVILRHWSARFRRRHPDAFSRLLSRAEFRRLLPHDVRVQGSVISPTFLAVGGDRGGAE